MEVARIATKGRFPLSAVSIGLGVVLPPESCLRDVDRRRRSSGCMGRSATAKPGTPRPPIWVEGAEPICAGLISAAALMGICDALIDVLIA